MEKTIKTMLALMAGALTFSACSSDEFANNVNNGANNGANLVTLTAYQEGDAISRAAIGTTSGTSTTINWTANDAIGVFASTGSPTQYTTTTGGSTSATFTGAEVTDAAYALYPYQSAATAASDAISGVVIPTTQTATSESFDPAAAIMVGTVSGSSITFKNVCSYLKITTDAAYTKIVVTTNQNAPIAGTFTVTPSTGAATATAGKNSITLAPTSGTMAAGTYYVAIAPTSTVMQFAVDCYTSDGVAKEKVKYYTSAGSFERKKDYNLTGTGTTSSWSALDANLLSGWYSVSGDKLVHVTKGNLYWNGSEWKLESSQKDYPTEWSTSHVMHLYWTKTAENSYAQDYSDGTNTTSDIPFFAESKGGLVVNGTSGLYALTSDERTYMLNTRTMTNSKLRYIHTLQIATIPTETSEFIKDKKGIFIFPDDYNGSYAEDSWDKIATAGIVFLPAANVRSGSSVSSNYVGMYGSYWSATPSATDTDKAYVLYFFYARTIAPANNDGRTTARSVRLVR